MIFWSRRPAIPLPPLAPPITRENELIGVGLLNIMALVQTRNSKSLRAKV